MPIRSTRHASVIAACLVLGLLSGCDKLKAKLGKGDDAGTAAPPGAGGGVLSFLGTDFEGEITANLTTKGAAAKAGPQQLVFGIKKPKYRIDMTAGGALGANPMLASGGAFLVDAPAKKGFILVPAQKMAMVVDFEKMKNLPKGQIPGMPNAPKGTAPSQPPQIEKTSKKDVVAGYGCEIWNVTSEGKKAEVCVAEGLTWIDLSDLGWSSPELTVATVASGANRFPLRVIAFDATGAEETRMETTKIDKKALADDRFVVPSDYRVVDMSALMGGLGGLGGLPGIPSTPTGTPSKKAR